MAETSEPCKWPMGRIAWRQTVALGTLSPDVIAGCYARAWSAWSEVCGIQPVAVALPDFANFWAYSSDGTDQGFDADDTILALTELPCRATQDTSIWQRINDHEVWTEDFLYGVLLHEIGHALGLVHTAEPNETMNPYYNPALTGLTPGAIAEGVSRYGPPIAPTPAPAPAPSPDGRTIQGDFDQPISVDMPISSPNTAVMVTFRFAEAGDYTLSYTITKKLPSPSSQEP